MPQQSSAYRFVQHPVRMRSLKKVTDQTEIDKWLRKHFMTTMDIIVEPNCDGEFVNCTYTNGELNYIATRGDTFTGRNVTHIAKYIKDIPKRLEIDADVEIRGDLYIPQDSAYAEEHKNRSLLNVVAGLISRKHNLDDLRFVRFVAFDVLHLPAYYETEKLSILEKLVPNVVYHERILDIQTLFDTYMRYFTGPRDIFDYAFDGLALIVNDLTYRSQIEDISRPYPLGAISWEFPPETKETKIITVEWHTGKRGKVVPMAIFEPVEVEGVTLQKASIGSARKFELLKLDIGDIIRVGRSKGIVPKIFENVTKGIKND